MGQMGGMRVDGSKRVDGMNGGSRINNERAGYPKTKKWKGDRDMGWM